MRRRKFIALLGSAALWPLPARAQQRVSVRRIGIFMPGVPDDAEHQTRNAAFLQGLGEAGWIVGHNLRIDYRWGAGDTERYRAHAADLVALGPDVILAVGTSTVSALLRATRSVPIVFASVTDPVGSSLIASLARPGGNATGFTSTEFRFGGKWLELLKEIAPDMTRTAVMRSSAIASQMGLFGAIQSLAPSLGIELHAIDTQDADSVEQAVATFAGRPNGGLIVSAGARQILFGDLIVTLAARHRLPAIYAYRNNVARGGLISYGVGDTDQFRRAAAYVDRILKGEKPGDLPVQAPTTYELAVNLRTAKVLGLEIPATLLGRADEVIE
jgi:putative tryptophan/tyrosine transport system substrate-binding protein